MATNLTIGAMRQILADGKASWTIDPHIADNITIPKYPTGIDLSQIPLSTDVPRIDISIFLKTKTANPSLGRQSGKAGFLKVPNLAEMLRSEVVTALYKSVSAIAISNWCNLCTFFTNIIHQLVCQLNWLFKTVRAIESAFYMGYGGLGLSIDGGVQNGLGVKYARTSVVTTAFNRQQSTGITGYKSRPYETTRTPAAPVSEGGGSTPNNAGYVKLNNIADQKAWIDLIGPINACFTCYNDFYAFGFTHQTGVYKPNMASGVAGGHSVTIAGYDDARQAWLVKSLWGEGWGMAGSPGYVWVGYGQSDIDKYVKYGIPNAAGKPGEPTKRRSHNGNLFESGNGQLFRNFEVFTTAAGNVINRYHGDGTSKAWPAVETLAGDAAGMPAVTAAAYNKNIDIIYPTTNRTLHHRFFEQASQKWKDGGTFGPENVNGPVGFIQGSAAAPANFDVVVALTNGILVHWCRNAANQAWGQRAVFGSDVAFGAPTLIERFDSGLDYVCVNKDGSMQQYSRPDGCLKWQTGENFGANVKTPPVMIRSRFGITDETAPGTYELCVAVNGQVQHWRTPGGAATTWKNMAAFGTNVQSVTGVIEGNTGFDLEVIALLNDGSLQHFYHIDKWHAGPVFGGSPLPVAAQA